VGHLKSRTGMEYKGENSFVGKKTHTIGRERTASAKENAKGGEERFNMAQEEKEKVTGEPAEKYTPACHRSCEHPITKKREVKKRFHPIPDKRKAPPISHRGTKIMCWVQTRERNKFTAVQSRI